MKYSQIQGIQGDPRWTPDNEDESFDIIFKSRSLEMILREPQAVPLEVSVSISYLAEGSQSIKSAISDSPFFLMAGTLALFAGNPTTSIKNGFSLDGRLRILLRNFIGAGV
jgi:hypothetical protein